MMEILTQNASQKGGIGHVLFHCVFEPIEGSVTHFMHDIDELTYSSLPNLYAVCIATKNSQGHQVKGGMFIKTSYSSEEPDYLISVQHAALSIPQLAPFMAGKISMLSAKHKCEGPAPTESEMLNAMMQQYIKLSSSGTA